MVRKVVIAVDSFKGSLSASEAAAALAAGVRSVVRDAEVVEMPLSDGGEGFAELLCDHLGLQRVEVESVDALSRRLVGWYGLSKDGLRGVVDVASTIGLTHLSAAERNPMKCSSAGAGRVIAAALKRGVRELYVGLGGSATVDCGVGLLRELGYRFRDLRGDEVGVGGEALGSVAEIDGSGVMPELAECRIVVAVDVLGPLCGPKGAARLFGPQKGASAEDVEVLEEGVRNFARVVERSGGPSIDNLAGAGAAGGIGGGLCGLAGGEIRSGLDIFLEAVGFDAVLEGADLVITGEGRIDSQTLLGKVPSGVLRSAQRKGIPVVAVGGGVELGEELLQSGFEALVAATPEDMELSEALRPSVAKENLARAGAKIARQRLENEK